MSWTCIEGNKQSIARKRHVCDVCGERIEKGDKQITRAGIQHGEGFVRMHMHLECEEYSRKWDDMDWECHCSGDVSRKEVIASFYPPNA